MKGYIQKIHNFVVPFNINVEFIISENFAHFFFEYVNLPVGHSAVSIGACVFLKTQILSKLDSGSDIINF